MESYKEGVKAKLPALTLYLGLVVIFIVFAVICSMMGKNFLTLNNMFNIITQASIISIIAIGASLVIVTGGIDLSVGSIVGFVGIFGGLILKAGLPWGFYVSRPALPLAWSMAVWSVTERYRPSL